MDPMTGELIALPDIDVCKFELGVSCADSDRMLEVPESGPRREQGSSESASIEEPGVRKDFCS